MGVLFSDKVRANSEVTTGAKPTPASEIVFRIKASVLQAKRIFQNIFSGEIQPHSKKDASGFGRSAYLVDEYWPELDEYIADHKSDKDILGLPINGKKFSKPNYAWSVRGFQKVSESRLTTIIRAVESRNLGPQGAARQKAMLRNDERLAHPGSEKSSDQRQEGSFPCFDARQKRRIRDARSGSGFGSRHGLDRLATGVRGFLARSSCISPSL
jgi:hypothetical protein